MFKFLFGILLLNLFLTYTKAGAVPIILDAKKGNKGNLEFALQLPNNDTVQIDLSFQLLTLSETLPVNPVQNSSVENDISTTSSPSTTEIITTEYPEPKYVTIDEAIEAFRQNLIKKEIEIAGIIESIHPFYRHFKLQFTDDIELTIRCTYNSNYKKRALNILCYEYQEFETERILGNGEIELVRIQDTNYKTDVEFVDARNIKQVYTMEIS